MNETDRSSVAIPDRDAEARLLDQVRTARARRRRLLIQGGGTKAFYGHPVVADETLDMRAHQGVVAYEPTELVVTLRAGTPLDAVDALLAGQRQQLPFEPPRFGPGATVGGMVAAGLSGPRRVAAGSPRDALLGVRVLNGQGQALDFGGRVMKNVAGYDVSRLMAGSLGVLGVLLEVSLKVAPLAPQRLTLIHATEAAEALRRMRAWARRALPITATAWCDGLLRVRLCGSDAALTETEALIGGQRDPEGDAFWVALREQRLGFFSGPAPLWRLAVKPDAPAALLAGEQVIEWGGALRWWRGGATGAGLTGEAERLRALAQSAGGHATLFRAPASGAAGIGVFAPLDPVVLRLHRNLKQAFDPDGLFNPGHLYPEL